MSLPLLYFIGACHKSMRASLGTNVFIIECPFWILCLALRDWSVLIIFYCSMGYISWKCIFPFKEILPNWRTYHKIRKHRFCDLEPKIFQKLIVLDPLRLHSLKNIAYPETVKIAIGFFKLSFSDKFRIVQIEIYIHGTLCKFCKKTVIILNFILSC